MEAKNDQKDVLSGRVALVTGGVTGLGRAISLGLARAGASVVALDVSATSHEIAAQPGPSTEPIELHVDVCDAAACERAVVTALDAFSRVDILVNNAGVVTSSTIVDMDEAEWDLVMDVNAKGTFLMTRAVLPSMLARQSGTIVNVASREGKRGSAGIAHYCAAKAAVINFTRALALEAAPGVRANCVCPGVAETSMVRARLAELGERQGVTPDAVRAEWVSGIPLARLQPVEAIAAAVVFLASDDASEITGQALSVDGGSVMV